MQVKNSHERTKCELDIWTECSTEHASVYQPDRHKTRFHTAGSNLKKSLFNTPHARNDGEECNLTNTPFAHRPVFVLQMRTSCSDHRCPTKSLTRHKLE